MNKQNTRNDHSRVSQVLRSNHTQRCSESQEEMHLFKSDSGLGARFLEMLSELTLKDKSAFASSLSEFRV